jgi:glycosyltransferase involved in cell wall biosynthesis
LYVRKQSVARSQQSGGNVCDFDIPKTWEVKELWGPRLWTQVRLAIEIWLHPPDVFFAPAHTVPWIHPKETIVTVHGLEYEFCPEAYSWWERCYMRWSIKHSCRWASKIIAVSENTKRDLMKLYGVPEEKISVIYEGVEGGELGMKNEELGRNSKFQIQNFKLQINSKFQISKPYFWFIGRIEARKNVARMIEAFDMFKRKCGTEHKLVLAGKPGFGYEKIEHSSDVLELGYVSGEEKWELLWSAEGFLFPSLYEGFGLPVLEAQAVGVPVLTSTTSSLPEIACHVARERRDEEKCAVFVDPLDVEDIALGIEKLALDRGFRSAIIEGGLRNVKRFSWETCAKKIATLLLYGNTSRFSGIWKKKYREGSLGA